MGKKQKAKTLHSPEEWQEEKRGRKPKIAKLPPAEFNLAALMEESRTLDERGWLKKLSLGPAKGTRAWLENRENILKDFECSGITRDEVENSEPAFTDPEEVGRFLRKPRAVQQCRTIEEAEHCLALVGSGFELLAIDTRCPDARLRDLFDKYLLKLREKKPISLPNTPGRQPIEKVIDESTLGLWHHHKILPLHFLNRHGHEPDTEQNRFDIAAWLFPDIENAQNRWKALEKSQEILNGAIESLRPLDAQIRESNY